MYGPSNLVVFCRRCRILQLVLRTNWLLKMHLLQVPYTLVVLSGPHFIGPTMFEGLRVEGLKLKCFGQRRRAELILEDL